MAGYQGWSQQQLIARIKELEAKITPQEDIVAADYTPNSTSIPAPSPVEDSPQSIPQPEPKKYRKPPKHAPKAFDASKYSTRLIALKFAYLGQKYNGFEHHKNNSTPLPTIEEELWKALVKTRLINPVSNEGDTGAGTGGGFKRVGKNWEEKWEREGARDVNWDGCEYSKCGRTDRGVSAFGQVIGVRVRSNKPLSKPTSSPNEQVQEEGVDSQEGVDSSLPVPDETQAEDIEPPFDDLQDELSYIQLLNRVLPPDIRIYAWCPNPPPDFSARFSCKERRYKYFFTTPCYAPVPGPTGLYHAPSDKQIRREGWLDIAAMQQAATSLIGLHDFRNMCKIDASKQITNFKRRIFHASIEEISPLAIPAFLSHAALHSPASTDPTHDTPKVYAFELNGSAFLWHQVRSIIAILFTIGQGLESPDLVPQLLDISANPTRPKYEMASDAPLVLWDCIFPHEDEVQSAEDRETGYEDRLNWVYVGDEGGQEAKGQLKRGGVAGVGKGKWGRGGVIDDVWEVWRRAKMEETLAALLLDSIAARGVSTLDNEKNGREEMDVGIGRAGPRGFDGGDLGKAKGNYIRVLDRERQETVEVVNERYAKKKGLDTKAGKATEEEMDIDE
ncbi:pseudouridine synthase [Pleomassaria siparia CBS 279.74]|uniref:Pseudouridine synthase n=1 Tax=Pleomassaria siparia CBS 279.74 TaxID=1314801 RepID=A0A6G1K618_9PLEO|nr:pseudouridine synthase [Pleomassaria siparia CBS 279.74]